MGLIDSIAPTMASEGDPVKKHTGFVQEQLKAHSKNNIDEYIQTASFDETVENVRLNFFAPLRSQRFILQRCFRQSAATFISNGRAGSSTASWLPTLRAPTSDCMVSLCMYVWSKTVRLS